MTIGPIRNGLQKTRTAKRKDNDEYLDEAERLRLLGLDVLHLSVLAGRS